MKKILVIGMYENAMYHPLTGVDEALEKMFPEPALTITDRITALDEAEQYDCVISYWDDWNNPIPDPPAEMLYQYIDKGGSLLVLHNGISLQLQEPLKEMIGGKFITHPEQELLTFLPKEQALVYGPSLTRNCTAFAMTEEPYQFELEDDRKEIFLTYTYHGKEYPAGWRKTFGKGKVVYLAPGHTADKFACEQYIRLIQNCMDWLL